MSITRKDVRVKLHPDYHAKLTEIADHDGVDPAAWVEELAMREIDRRAHDAIELSERLARRGFAGKSGELQGRAGSCSATGIRK